MTTTLDLQPSPPDGAFDEPYRVHTVTSRAGLDRFADAWQSLGEKTGGPIEQYEWTESCVDVYRGVGDLHVVTVSRDEELVAVAPMAIKSINGVRRAVMLGVDECHEPMDLLAAGPSALAQLVESLAGQSLPMIFRRLPADSPSVEALRNRLAPGRLVLARPQPSCPFISLDSTWTEPGQHLSSRRRSDLRRARRRAEKLGEVTSEILSPRPDQVDALLDEAFDIESRSWKGETGSALSFAPTEAAFCRHYARAACRAGMLRLCYLRIGGRRVAMQIAMVKGGGFWLLKIGYDIEFARCSPGILLLHDSIAHAAHNGLNTYEFLGLSESWIRVWAQHERPCVSLGVYPYTPRGGAALAADVAAKLGGEMARRVRLLALKARGAAKACVMPLMKWVARNYIAGDTLDDALRVKRRLAERGISATIGFWNTQRDPAREVADQYLQGLDALAAEPHTDYLSIKLPALCFSKKLVGEVVERARSVGRRIHLDSLAPEDADRTRSMVEEALAAGPGVDVGYTLPGRWLRSRDDARWASDRGLFVRVVKGEWTDPADPQRHKREGFLEVIDTLAGRARRVGVATHDPTLAAEAIRRLQKAGTPCDLELLYGLPMRDVIRRARDLGVGVRVYVPYGEAYMPYALSQVRRKPRIVWWLLKDITVSMFDRRGTVSSQTDPPSW